MAKFALVNCFAYVHSHDFTVDANEWTAEMEAEALDATTFGSGGWKEHIAGLKSIESSLAGLWEAGDDSVDSTMFSDLGTANRVHTIGPAATETSICYMFQAGRLTYQMFGEIGQVAPFSLTSQGSNGVGVVRGQLAKAKGSVSATGALGSAVQLGEVSASQYLYATLHVFGTPGTTITVKVQSDDNSDFSSATDRITFGPITAAGGTWGTRVAGAITDTHYRMTVSAITGTFVVAGAIGIG
jgi:hypothetical protein